METLLHRNVCIGNKDIFKITLLRSNDFEPAFEHYAEKNELNYGSLQFVLGVRGNSDTHLHSNDIIITKEKVQSKILVEQTTCLKRFVGNLDLCLFGKLHRYIKHGYGRISCY